MHLARKGWGLGPYTWASGRPLGVGGYIRNFAPGGRGCWALRWGTMVWPQGGKTREEFFLPAALPRQKFSHFALKTEAFPYFGSIWHNFRPLMAAEGGT